jgi:hypothetical protein
MQWNWRWPRPGVKTFVAAVLQGNYPVLRVLSDAGLAVRRQHSDGVLDVSMAVPPNAALDEASVYLDAVAGRDPSRRGASFPPGHVPTIARDWL